MKKGAAIVSYHVCNVISPSSCAIDNVLGSNSSKFRFNSNHLFRVEAVTLCDDPGHWTMLNHLTELEKFNYIFKIPLKKNRLSLEVP